MDTVRMVHPLLEGRRIEVRACAVPHHERSGWQVENDRPEPAAESTAARRRRREKRSE